MLVLSRKSRESVMVGNPDFAQPVMKITVLGIRNGKVTLGFDVADDVPVHRGEVWERIHAAGRSSGPTTAPVAPVA